MDIPRRNKTLRILRHYHTQSINTTKPSEILKKNITQIDKFRKKENPTKKPTFRQSKSYLDTATLPMILTAVGGALFAKLLMMHDDSKWQEMIERMIRNAPEGQGTVRMLSREEWEEIKDLRPRTPFESKLTRPNARIEPGRPLEWKI